MKSSATTPTTEWMTMSDPFKWALSDVKNVIEGNPAPDSHIIETLRTIVTIMEEEQNSNFILGKVIIENDMLDDDDDDD